MARRSSVPANVTVVVAPEEPNTVTSVFKFSDALRVDQATVSKHNVQMQREDNRSIHESHKYVQEYGEGSEFGKAARIEARQKKRGYNVEEYSADNQPWLMTLIPKEGAQGARMRRLRGMRDRATTDSADYWMMVKEGNRMVATPIDEWYNFVPMPTHRVMNDEEAEAAYARRDKMLNLFALKATIKDEEDEETTGEEAPKAAGRSVKDTNDGETSDDEMLSDIDDSGSQSDEMPIIKRGKGKTLKGEDVFSGSDDSFTHDKQLSDERQSGEEVIKEGDDAEESLEDEEEVEDTGEEKKQKKKVTTTKKKKRVVEDSGEPVFEGEPEAGDDIEGEEVDYMSETDSEPEAKEITKELLEPSKNPINSADIYDDKETEAPTDVADLWGNEEDEDEEEEEEERKDEIAAVEDESDDDDADESIRLDEDESWRTIYANESQDGQSAGAEAKKRRAPIDDDSASGSNVQAPSKKARANETSGPNAELAGLMKRILAQRGATTITELVSLLTPHLPQWDRMSIITALRAMSGRDNAEFAFVTRQVGTERKAFVTLKTPGGVRM